jgi:hypothetical protein
VELNKMFDSKHYVPILKWKRAEQGAMTVLSKERKQYISPLIQFVMSNYDPEDELEEIVQKFEGHLPEIPGKVIAAWGTTPVFVDVSLLFTTILKAKSLDFISRSGYLAGGAFIPVIHLDDDPAIKRVAYSIAKDYESGICLRLICPDFSDPNKLNRAIVKLLADSGLKEKNIDLLIDIKETGGNGNKYAKYFNLSQTIPTLSKWRTFIFAGGAFPEDLSGCTIDEENLVPRTDWQNWNKLATKRELRRKPAFSDYTIQYPIYKEKTQFFPPTASIKYTLDDEWLIMKGQKQIYSQYLAHAALLVNDPRFYGKDFSFGDQYISKKAQHLPVYMGNPSIKGTGSTESWVKAGINHHLTLVAYQIANLPWK